MNYTYHGTTDLIALPNRTVQTYPSGLVRVERSFVCRKDQVARYRNTIKVNEPMPFDDGAPAIDGLYIFPEPQEAARDDGFVEFRVTAYGRTKEFDPNIVEKNTVLSSYFEISTFSLAATARTLPSINETYTFRAVLPSSEPTSALITPPKIDQPIVLKPDGSRLTPSSIIGNFNVSLDGQTQREVLIETEIEIKLSSYNASYYGAFTEYVIVWESTVVVVASAGEIVA